MTDEATDTAETTEKKKGLPRRVHTRWGRLTTIARWHGGRAELHTKAGVASPGLRDPHRRRTLL